MVWADRKFKQLYTSCCWPRITSQSSNNRSLEIHGAASYTCTIIPYGGMKLICISLYHIWVCIRSEAQVTIPKISSKNVTIISIFYELHTYQAVTNSTYYETTVYNQSGSLLSARRVTSVIVNTYRVHTSKMNSQKSVHLFDFRRISPLSLLRNICEHCDDRPSNFEIINCARQYALHSSGRQHYIRQLDQQYSALAVLAHERSEYDRQAPTHPRRSSLDTHELCHAHHVSRHDSVPRLDRHCDKFTWSIHTSEEE